MENECFVSFVQFKGAIVGLLTGFAFNLWMGLGSMLTQPYYPTLEKDYVDRCPEKYFNATGHAFNITAHNEWIQSQIERT